ncbi:RDH1_3 [Sanghuangporus weigelae]
MSKLDMLGMFLDQAYPPSPKFTEADVPDLSGKVVVVTGGNTGLGKETVRVVLEHGAKVYVACRSEEKANAAIKELREQIGKDGLHFISLDLSSFASIKKAVEELKSKEVKLDILFNNAGVMSPPVEQLTEDGYDMTFGTNVVGPFVFTKLLLPLLQRAASENGDARIVNTSSLGHAAAPKEYIMWETLKPGEKDGPADKKRRKFGPDNLYYQSKCGVIMVANEWARRYGNQGIISCSLHPGTAESELGRHWPAFQKRLMGIFIKLKPTSLGAITQIYAGTSPEGKGLNGKYLIPWARVGKPREDILDEKKSTKLWDWLEEQTRFVVESSMSS